MARTFDEKRAAPLIFCLSPFALRPSPFDYVRFAHYAQPFDYVRFAHYAQPFDYVRFAHYAQDDKVLRDATLSPSTTFASLTTLRMTRCCAMLRSALRLRIASRCYAQDDSGLDIVGEGELYRARRAVFAGDL